MHKNANQQKRINMRRKQVAKLFGEGLSQLQIAAKLGINQSTISRDLAILDEKNERRAVLDYGKIREEQLEKLDRLEAAYLAGFERSRRRSYVNKDGEVKTYEVPGDAKFLNGAQSVIGQRSKMLGLDEAQKVEIRGSLKTETDLVLTVRRVDIDERLKMVKDDIKYAELKEQGKLSESETKESDNFQNRPRIAIPGSYREGRL